MRRAPLLRSSGIGNGKEWLKSAEEDLEAPRVKRMKRVRCFPSPRWLCRILSYPEMEERGEGSRRRVQRVPAGRLRGSVGTRKVEPKDCSMFHAESPAGRMMKIGFERMTVERKRQIQVLQLIACDHDRIGPARRRTEREEEKNGTIHKSDQERILKSRPNRSTMTTATITTTNKDDSEREGGKGSQSVDRIV